MKLYIELISAVSLTGTIPFCVYLLFRKRFDTKISAAFQYNIMKLLLFCFIIPFSLLKSLAVSSIFPRLSLVFDEYIYLDNKIIQTSNGFHLQPQGGFYKALLLVWLIALSCVAAYYISCYLYFRYKILHCLEPDTLNQKEFTIQKKQLGLNPTISLLYCDEAVSPFTYGFFHPCVVITSIVPKDAVPMVIRHELQHIRSHDFLWRAAAFAVVLIHCWNPFIYLFWKEFCEIQEIACDAKTTAPFSPGEIRLYGYSMLDIATSVRKYPSPIIRLADKDRKSAYRRITRLSTSLHRKSIFISIFLFFSCLIGFCMPVMACSPEIVYLGEGNDDLASGDWIYMESVNDDTAVPICPEDELYFQYSDQYLLFDDGTILAYPISASSYSQERAACTHTWQNVTLKQHQYEGEGCTVYTYSAAVCTKCGKIKNKKLISKVYYAVCPH